MVAGFPHPKSPLPPVEETEGEKGEDEDNDYHHDGGGHRGVGAANVATLVRVNLNCKKVASVN